MNNFFLKSLTIFSLLITTITFNSAQAEYYAGPFNNNTDTANLAQKIVNLIDNGTVGSIQTVFVGGGNIIYHLIMNKGSVDFDFHNNGKSEVTQVIIREPAVGFPQGAYSVGVFQANDYPSLDDHEGGHAVASAALGPLYLPSVGLSYLIQGHHDSIFEDWADMEINPAEFAWTSQVQVGLGQTEINGNKKDVLVFKFSLDQTQYQTFNDLEQTKIYRWFNTKVMTPLMGRTRDARTSDEDCNCDPTLQGAPHNDFSISLLTKDLELITNREGATRFLIQSRHNYGTVEGTGGNIFVRPLDWQARFGAEFELFNDLDFQISAGPKLGTTVYAPLADSMSAGEDMTFSFDAGLVAQAGLTYKDYLRLQSNIEQTWSTTGKDELRVTTELTNEFRNPTVDFGFMNSVEFGVRHRYENINFANGQSLEVNGVEGTVGFRF